MRVLVCIPCLMTGGTEIQTLNLVNALVAAGHDVITVCYFEYLPEMVANYERAGSRVVLLSPNGERPAGVMATVKSLFKGFRHVLKCERPDVAHVQYMAPGVIPIIILRLLGVKRIVATAHTPADIYPSLRVLHLVSRYILTAFQCITKRAEESFFGKSQMYAHELNLKSHGNHFTIYNAIPSYISVADRQKSFGKLITIGVVSRLEPIKGMDLVVPAFMKIHAENSETRLLIVGDGSQRLLMEQQVHEAGLDNVVCFAGRQPQEALQQYYDRIDILLMPSRSEGFGLTAIEGMARGCVLVAANTGGLPEIVLDGKVGLLHVPEDVQSLKDRVSMLVNNLAELERMSKNAMTYVLNFSIEKYNRQIKDWYSKLS